jgi:hypothetical protein
MWDRSYLEDEFTPRRRPFWTNAMPERIHNLQGRNKVAICSNGINNKEIIAFTCKNLSQQAVKKVVNVEN